MIVSPRRALELEGAGDLITTSRSTIEQALVELEELRAAADEEHSRPQSRQFFWLGRHRPWVADKSSRPGATNRPSKSGGSRRRFSWPHMKRSASSTSAFAGTAESDSATAETLAEEPAEGLGRPVTFSVVSVRLYPVVLGDHPCCSSGFPLSLGWDHDPARTYVRDLEWYEAERSWRRRHRDKLRMGPEERERVLRGLYVAGAGTGEEDGNSEGPGEALASAETTERSYNDRDNRRADC